MPVDVTCPPVPLALYVHLPWCVRKCPYCDFNSHAAPAVLDTQRYVGALLEDLRHEVRRQALPPVSSIFIGGGTPSLFDGPAIDRLLRGIDQLVSLAADVEITLEANPGTAEAARFAAYRAAGVNRLSLGVQSLDDSSLQALGRIHSAQEACRAYDMARDASFDNINLDLMYGLPNQTTELALTDLASVIALEPEHLSWYQLTLEPNTPFHHRPPPVPDDDAVAEIMDAGQPMLARAGYRQYEISAYARNGRECRHNRNYWQFGDYLGIGAGAHGKLTDPAGAVLRRTKQRQPAAYLEAAPQGALSREYAISGAELPVEFFLNGMRLNEGVPRAWFQARTGLPLASIAAQWQTAMARGLVADDADRLRPTARGQRYLNDLLALFEPDGE